jgi:HSP20 family protein
MYETIDERVIQLDLPGMNEKGVQVSITADLLSVKGQRRGTEEAKPEAYYSAERWTGKFERMFQVPISVKADQVRASYQDGVLTVRLPKRP